MTTLTLNKEDVFATFQSLVVEETRLTEEKKDLTIMLFQLETKFKEEVKKMKQTVDRLNSEVLELREKCNKLRLWIKEGLTSECSQATRPEDKDRDSALLICPGLGKLEEMETTLKKE
jgi:hypothetical protein